MRELVGFTQHLLEAEADLDAHGEIRERIEAASRELSAAEEELGRQRKKVDARTEELVVKRKSLQDEQAEKKGNLTQLRIQLDSCRRSEREAREMLERASRHLSDMQAEVQRRRDEAERNRVQRDVGIGLMFLPIIGTIIGATLVGCGHVAMEAAEAAAGEAQKAVDQHAHEVYKYSVEVCSCSAQEQQTEAEIAADKRRLAQIDEEKQALDRFQEEIVALQSGLRKCTTFINVLAGRVWVVERLTKDLLIYEEIAGILGEVVQQVLPLTSPGGEAGTRFLALGELRDLTEKLKSGSQGLRALADAESAAIDY